ncbi:armadillo-type protein [Echria macrotheca]|uniref:Nucleolar protein 9 n=1 Tax=Echria macrotheca TaxID=438768 RepID=A0AAJ0BFC4_9PEZI|nr:armadillo-type protein [Echria macrotheca]
MGKNRKSKRQLVRDEKRAKKRARDVEESEPPAKRQRHESDAFGGDDAIVKDQYVEPTESAHRSASFEREFFGMLEDQEQEYFRRADELLELNDFPSTEERDIFLQNVYKEAVGKELKLASSQSCSRLMERLILLSNTRQKKHLFQAFAGHFISLVTHRFASHCCEKLFLQSAPVVTQELGGLLEEVKADSGEDEEQQSSMEDMFLLTLDELEEHMSYLVSDRYGSHALRVLLIALSGRPLVQADTTSLLRSKKKEFITVEGASALTSELAAQNRAVPSSFMIAIEKIIVDSTADLDATALRVLAKHPTGNPTLQLLLDLELSLLVKGKGSKKKGEEEEQSAAPSLLEKLVPGAPGSFSEEQSPAAEFVNSMMYDTIGSRLLETLVTKSPGKIFKGLYANFFGPRISSLLRNEIASYPAICALNRLSKEDLAVAVEQSLPEIPRFVERGRFSVIKALFDRCNVRQATDEISSLLAALSSACGGDWKYIIPRLCFPKESEDEPKEKVFQQDQAKTKNVLLGHAGQLIAKLLEIPGPTCKAMQTSINHLDSKQLLEMATGNAATSTVLINAFSTPARIPAFHKILAASLLPHTHELAVSNHGYAILNAIISVPSRGEEIAVPFHIKENMMSQLEAHEDELKTSWVGRNVWRTWRGDMWSYKRHDWVRLAKETNPEDARLSAVPKPREKMEVKGGNKFGKGKFEGRGARKGKGEVALEA